MATATAIPTRRLISVDGLCALFEALVADGYHVIGPSGRARPGAERAHSRRRRAAAAVRVGGDRARMDRQMDTGDLGRR